MGGRGRGRGRSFSRGYTNTHSSEESPPELYPTDVENRLPGHSPTSRQEEQNTGFWRKLSQACRASPFYKDPPPDRLKALEGEIRAYASTGAAPAVREPPAGGRDPLFSVVTLHEAQVPRELFSAKESRAASAAAAPQAQGAYFASRKRRVDEGSVLETFTRREQQAGARKEAEDGSPGGGLRPPGGEGQRQGDGSEAGSESGEDEPEDEDEAFAQDDYLQGEAFDDDEGFDEGDDGDEGAIF